MLKTVFKNFGSYFISIFVAICLFIILANTSYEKDGKTYTGLYEIIGKASTIENTTVVSDNTIFENFMSSPSPEIIFNSTGNDKIETNVDCEILKYFKVRFNDQVDLIDADSLIDTEFEITEIIKENGNNVLNLYDKENKTINFNDPGIYTFTLYTIHNQKETIAKVKIPVD